jgi:putative transposase
MISKRPKRLAGVPYVGDQRYSLTTCTGHRHRAFALEGVAEGCIMQLRHSAKLHNFAVVAYCFMPDHLHLLVYGTSPDADFLAFVIHFKKLTGFEYSQRFRRRLWQPGYYDRILRDDESTEGMARYVLENPVRGGLARTLGEYPYAGSDLYDLKGMLMAWDRQV